MKGAVMHWFQWNWLKNENFFMWTPESTLNQPKFSTHVNRLRMDSRDHPKNLSKIDISKFYQLGWFCMSYSYVPDYLHSLYNENFPCFFKKCMFMICMDFWNFQHSINIVCRHAKVMQMCWEPSLRWKKQFCIDFNEFG